MKASILLLIAAGMLGAVPSPNNTLNRYRQKNLAADAGNVAERVNADLVNPWGMARSPAGHWWIASNTSGMIIALTDQGFAYPGRHPAKITVPSPRIEAGPSSPTGVVFNNTSDFILAAGKPARLIIVTEEGTLSAWNPEVDKDKAILAADKSAVAVYRGVTIGRMDGESRLYAANFFGRSIDVFDTYFHELTLQPGAFVDPELLAGYAPYNVQEIGGRIYVAYGLQDSNQADAERGAGFGYVAVFDGSGRLISRLKSGPELNAPWGMALAPPGFGKYGNMLLVGNAGDGTIAAYDRATGEFKGLLEGANGDVIMIQGLRGIAAGRNGPEAAAAAVYFCAAIEEGEHGLFGFLTPRK